MARLIVWRAITFGCCVVGGHIALQPDFIFLLSGRGASFRHTTFSGGGVLCPGADFSGTFQSCTFKACTLKIVHGASASITGCTWSDCQGAALVAHGPATAATVTGCAFHGCRYCIITEAGATVSMHSSALTDAVTAVAVNDPGSHVSAADCTLCGTSKPGQTPLLGNGLSLHGGSASIHRCDIMWFESGVTACGGPAAASLEVRASSVRAPTPCDLRSHARVAFTDVCMRADVLPGDLKGMQVMVDVRGREADVGGALLQMDRCTVHGHPEHSQAVNVCVRGGGQAALHLCELRGLQNVSVGLPEQKSGGRAVMRQCFAVSSHAGYVVISEGCVLRVHGGAVTSHGCACVAFDRAVLAVSDTRLKGRAVENAEGQMLCGAVTLVGKARAYVLRCEIHDGFCGVHALLSWARVKDTYVVRMMQRDWAPVAKSPGLAAGIMCSASDVEMVGGSVEDCFIGVLALPRSIKHRGSVVQVRGVKFAKYCHGVQVGARCEAHLEGCQLLGHDGMSSSVTSTQLAMQSLDAVSKRKVQSGVAFCDSLRGSVRGCTFRRNAIDIVVTSEQSVQISGCLFEQSAGFATQTRAPSVRASSAVVLEACKFAGVQTALLAAEKSVCVLRRRTVSRTAKCGLQCIDGASVSLFECKVDVSEIGLANMGGYMDAHDCEGGTAAVKITEDGGMFTGERVKAHGGRFAVQTTFAGGPVPSVPPRTCVKLSALECTLSSPGTALFVTGSGFDVALHKTHLEKSLGGLLMSAGARVSMRHSLVKKCTYGIVVGDVGGGLAEHCGVCGIQGLNAVKHAWRTLQGLVRRGVKDKLGARCAHRGARSRLTLHDVECWDCKDVGLQVTKHGVVEATEVCVAGSKPGTGIVVASVSGLERSCFIGCTVDKNCGSRAVVAMRQIGAGDLAVEEEGGGYRGWRPLDVEARTAPACIVCNCASQYDQCDVRPGE